MSEPRSCSLYYQQGVLEMTLRPADSKGDFSTFRETGEAAAALKALRTAHPSAQEFETALPARNVMIMVLDLPSTDETELEGMVQLHAEEISPFPPERTCVSWEILQQEPPQTKVLMALCSRKELDQLQELYAETGSLPERVDVDVLGWLELLRNEDLQPDQDSALWLLLQGDHAVVVAWLRGNPCLIRSWIDARNFSAETLNEELMMLLLSLDASFELTDPQPLVLWAEGGLPDWAQEPPAGWRIESRPLETLHPLTRGLLLRSQRGQRLDLAPPEWKEEKKRATQRKKFLRNLSIGGGVWVLLMLLFVGWAQFRLSGLRRLQKQNRAERSAVENVQELSGKVRSLTQFTDRSSSALETMLLLASATPGSGTLIVDDYRYDKEQGVVFSGILTGDVQPFYQFLENLAAGDLLRVKSYDLKESRDGFRFQVETLWSWLREESAEGNP
ncbi:MAG: hypothetical protein ACO3N7_04290 [Kiritimatiellia bacterium]